MGRLDEFVAYLNKQVDDHCIYVWGAQGQNASVISESWIRRREADTGGYGSGVSYADAAIAFWKQQCALGFKNRLKAFDCSGLGTYWLCDLKHLISSDRNAHGLMGMCTLIDFSQRRRGCWLFRVNARGRATHIGYMVSDTEVVHAKGRSYGVVREKAKASYWHKCGIPKLFASEILGCGSAASTPADTNGAYVFNRVLKAGVKGEDVKALKKLLAAAGFTGLTVTNGNYLSATEAKVKQFQQARGLEVDGKAGKQTLTALGGTWAG